jgi:large subunit ribosomal protein L9
MKVILLESVSKLGQAGTIVEVAAGYARNYLIPRKKAKVADKKSITNLEQELVDLQKANEQKKSEAEKAIKKLAGTAVSIIRSAGDSGQLYGSVSGRDIVDAVNNKGFQIIRDNLIIDKAIKELGIYEFQVELFADVKAVILVNVARGEEEAKRQLQAYKDEA